MALGLGCSLVVGDLIGAGGGGASSAVVIEDYMWEAASGGIQTDYTYDAVTPIPTLYDFNDAWDLDTATGLVNGMYDYMPTDSSEEYEQTYDEGYWDVDGNGDLMPIDDTVFPNPFNG